MLDTRVQHCSEPLTPDIDKDTRIQRLEPTSCSKRTPPLAASERSDLLPSLPIRDERHPTLADIVSSAPVPLWRSITPTSGIVIYIVRVRAQVGQLQLSFELPQRRVRRRYLTNLSIPTDMIRLLPTASVVE